MKVSKVIEMLQAAQTEDVEVFIWNPDDEKYMPVTGMIYTKTEVKLYSDKD